MRNPVRSEADAFHIVVGSGAVLVAAVVVGALVSPWVGVALVAGALIGALVWEVGARDPERHQPLKEAMERGRSFGAAADGHHRVLVVANRTLQSNALRGEIAERANSGADVRLIVPILCSRAHYFASDIDRELTEARMRVDDVLAWAAEHDVRVSGAVGDPNVA